MKLGLGVTRWQQAISSRQMRIEQSAMHHLPYAGPEVVSVELRRTLTLQLGQLDATKPASASAPEGRLTARAGR